MTRLNLNKVRANPTWHNTESLIPWRCRIWQAKSNNKNNNSQQQRKQKRQWWFKVLTPQLHNHTTSVIAPTLVIENSPFYCRSLTRMAMMGWEADKRKIDTSDNVSTIWLSASFLWILAFSFSWFIWCSCTTTEQAYHLSFQLAVSREYLYFLNQLPHVLFDSRDPFHTCAGVKVLY